MNVRISILVYKLWYLSNLDETFKCKEFLTLGWPEDASRHRLCKSFFGFVSQYLKNSFRFTPRQMANLILLHPAMCSLLFRIGKKREENKFFVSFLPFPPFYYYFAAETFFCVFVFFMSDAIVSRTLCAHDVTILAKTKLSLRKKIAPQNLWKLSQTRN